jgi:hypothetical protein
MFGSRFPGVTGGGYEIIFTVNGLGVPSLHLNIPGLGQGFKVQGSGFRVWGSGFGVQGSGFRVQRRRRPKKRPVKSKKKL